MISAVFLIIAGFFAGIVTGLVGASAAVIVTPMLVAFLDYPAFTAIGISLATDVFASSTSALNYYRYKHIDLKNGIILTVMAVFGAFLGSILSSHMPDSLLGRGAGIAILIMGVNFIRKPINERLKEFREHHDLHVFKRNKTLSSIFFGLLIGVICGFIGAGGGIMILIILTFILGYEVKTAIGTSVLIMTFIALSGAIGHFIHTGTPLPEILITGTASIIGAATASKFANKTTDEKLSKTIGITFIALAIIMMMKKFMG
ncbi:MAG: TSUP family transporter [Candidatus Altiarchaeales archaeon]|nr:TSUP family transporter [Candidatus Altiarchaeales archaeon]MBD3416363.1 TSUP family transporter [Candidatus Altiarchaeales archaeon]